MLRSPPSEARDAWSFMCQNRDSLLLFGNPKKVLIPFLAISVKPPTYSAASYHSRQLALKNALDRILPSLTHSPRLVNTQSLHSANFTILSPLPLVPCRQLRPHAAKGSTHNRHGTPCSHRTVNIRSPGTPAERAGKPFSSGRKKKKGRGGLIISTLPLGFIHSAVSTPHSVSAFR